MSSIIQNIIILGGIIAILGLGYFLYTNNTKLDAGMNTKLDLQIAAENAEFVSRLKELQAIELRGEIFADPRFISLTNYGVPVIPEPVGRVNPFGESE
jgi:hypothetical protein